MNWFADPLHILGLFALVALWIGFALHCGGSDRGGR